MAITFLDEEPTGRKITFLDEETQKPVGTSIGQEISQLPAALKQSFGQPLEAIGETAQVAGFPAVGAALKGAIQEPEGYVSAGERFMAPKEGEFQVAGFAPQYAPRAIAEQTGQILGSIGTRLAGAVAGGGLGALISPATGVAGAAAGSFAGPALFEAAQIVGPVALERAKNNGYTEPTDEDMAYAITTAAGSGLLNAFGAKYLPGGEKAVGSFSKRLAASFIGEGIPEGLQSLTQQVGETVETKKGIQVNAKQAVGEALIGGGAGAAATVIAAPFTPEQIAEAKITESANKEAENLFIGNDNPQGKAVLANKQKLEQEIADAKQVLSAIESTDPVAQKLKLELKEKEAILAAAQGQVDSIVDSNDPVVEAEKQQIELAKEIAAPEVAAPVTPVAAPAPTEVTPTEVAVAEAATPVSTPVVNQEFKDELEMSGVAYDGDTRYSVQQSSNGTFRAERIVNGQKEDIQIGLPDIETAQNVILDSVGKEITPVAEIAPVVKETPASKPSGMSVEESKAYLEERNKSTIFGYPTEDIMAMQQGKQVGRAIPAPVAETPAVTEAPAAEVVTIQRDVNKPEQMTPEERGTQGHKSVIEQAKQDFELAKTGQTFGFSGGQTYKSKAAAIKDTKSTFERVSQPTEADIKRGASDHYGEINRAISDSNPVSAAAVDAYNITLPEGYTKQGDLYVYQPAVSETITPATTSAGKAKPKIKPQSPVLDPIGYGNALIDLFPGLKSAGVKVITMEESLNAIEKNWEDKRKSGKATRLDQLVYLANKKNAQKALSGKNVAGMWSKANKTVAVSPKATPSAMSHEIGHAIQEIEFANADQKTKDEIVAQYNKWFALKYSKDGVPSIADQRRIWEWMTDADWLDPKAPFPKELRVAEWEQYRSSFDEWFGDEVAKWATTREKPKSLVDKFFTEIGAKLKKLWNAISENFSPDETLAICLDSITNVSPSKTDFTLPTEKAKLLESIPEQTPIEPEAETITEAMAQGLDIGKEDNMPINNKIESHIKNFAFVRGIFESASDRLRRAKFTKLATAIDDYYDQAQRRLGFANKILLPAFDEYSKQSKSTKKKIDEEVKRFFAAQENKRDTAEFFDELNPITQKIVTAWQKFGEESGNENQKIGIKVFDKGLQRWRPIGRVEKFWPRVFKPEYKRALMEPDKYQKEYNEIVEALMKSGRIQTPEEAEVFISDYQGTGSQNDYFSGIEAARGQAFPEELYDYSTQVMTDYVARWAQHSSRIEQFGQKLGENSKTLWDRSRESTRDRRTIDYITSAQERVEGAYPNDPIVKGMATLNIWSSGLQLGNPASSMLNFFGGTTLNAMVGQPGALSSYVSSFAELRKLGRELKDAREKGIVSRDLMNIVGDHQVVLESSGLAKAGQKTTDFLLKWSGFTPVEQMVRTQSMIIGKSFLRKTLSSLSKNPNSSFSKRALTWLNRNNIDADKLIVEQGTGPETDKLLRYFANISQGSYTIAQTPIFTDTPIGRFLFKYQKFSTQVMRQSWKNTFEPAWRAVTNKNETLQLPDQTRQLLYRLRLAEAKELGDNRKITLDEIPKKVTKAEGKALTIIPVMMWLGASYVGGEVILRLRDMLFGVLMKGPSYEDIIKAFEDDEDDDELYLSLERAWYNLIGMGALGLIGNYGQFFMDWQDRERVKNPLDPPALSIFKETATFIQNAADQGKITLGDINNYLNRTFSGYRVSQRLYQTAASGLGYSKAPTVAEEMFRREVASINKYARRWASSAGLEYRTKRPMDIAPGKMTPINREIASYLQRGEPGAAVAYAKEYLNSLPKSERANAIQSMQSGARNRQPLRLGSGPMDQAEKTAFKKWLKEKVSKEKFDEIQKLESQYQKNYNIFLNKLPNK
jgi:hypothetical protein